jgi:hypothetical protein
MTKAITRLQIYPDPQYTAYDVLHSGSTNTELESFLAISAELTGFSSAELHATGNVRHLFEEFGTTLGFELCRHFVQVHLAPADRLASPFYGPIARNLIRMWYLGQWQRLPTEWVTSIPKEFQPFDEFGRNFNRVISAQAYKEGLAWSAIGANPPAAKQPGFASWAEPPT